MVRMPESKPRRRIQAERSALTRRKLLSAARDMFITDGYNATTMTRVAERAGVAVQTVYFVFHTKGELLTNVYETAVLGDNRPTPPDESGWYRLATTADDLHDAIAAFAGGCAAILRRTAPLEAVVRAAGPTEPGVQAAHNNGEILRQRGYRAFVDTLLQRRLLPETTDQQETADVLLTLLGPHVYATLTMDRGWSHQQYVDWAVRVIPQLLA